MEEWMLNNPWMSIGICSVAMVLGFYLMLVVTVKIWTVRPLDFARDDNNCAQPDIRVNWYMLVLWTVFFPVILVVRVTQYMLRGLRRVADQMVDDVIIRG